jgi:quercetin dioxygenase-like cupin family protein
MVDKTRCDALDAPLAGELATGLVAETMPSAVRERLRARVLERAGGIHVVRADAGEWVTLLPGIAVKRLRRDPVQRTETNLWRLDPGTIIPAHDHQEDEECLVLQGSIVQDAVEYHAGDYLHARAGSRHVPLRAPHGALLLIRSQMLGSYLAAR